MREYILIITIILSVKLIGGAMARQAKVDVKKAMQAKLKGQSYREIGKAQGVSDVAIFKAISPLLKQLPSAEEMAEIKRTTGDQYALAAYKALTAITDEKLAAANAKDLMMVSAIATDKNRLISGASTSNVHVLLQALELAEE